MNEVGEMIRHYRKKMGYSQKDLSEKAHNNYLQDFKGAWYIYWAKD